MGSHNPLGQKAYKLYNIETHQFFTSRDVIFHEDIFSYTSIPTSPSTTDSVTPVPILDTDISSSLPHTHADTSTPSLVPSPAPLRRSHRHHAPPVILRDYICNQVMSSDSTSPSSSVSPKGTRYPLSHFISYAQCTLPHRSFLTAFTRDIEYQNYE